jgi:hypothetical protein
MNALDQLRALRRGKVHAGYRWAAVMADGESICETCVEKEYSLIFKNTWLARRRAREGAGPLFQYWPDSQWQCIGVTHSGEHEDESPLLCVHCNGTIFEGVES